MTFKPTTRPVLVFLLICISLTSSSNLIAISNQAIVPLNITVLGKLVITDANNDNKTGSNPTLNVLLRLTPDLNNQTVSGSSAIRIRTNLTNWKLTALRSDLTNSNTKIDPNDISLRFSTQAGSTANPNCGKLLSPFDQVTSLSQIPTANPTEILVGNTKTSIAKDPDNKENWFQLNSNYSISPDFFYGIGEWNTTISYNLVSP